LKAYRGLFVGFRVPTQSYEELHFALKCRLLTTINKLLQFVYFYPSNRMTFTSLRWLLAERNFDLDSTLPIHIIIYINTRNLNVIKLGSKSTPKVFWPNKKKAQIFYRPNFRLFRRAGN